MTPCFLQLKCPVLQEHGHSLLPASMGLCASTQAIFFLLIGYRIKIILLPCSTWLFLNIYFDLSNLLYNITSVRCLSDFVEDGGMVYNRGRASEIWCQMLEYSNVRKRQKMEEGPQDPTRIWSKKGSPWGEWKGRLQWTRSLQLVLYPWALTHWVGEMTWTCRCMVITGNPRDLHGETHY